MSNNDFCDYYSRYNVFVRRCLHKRFPKLSPEDLEDLAQEVWLRVLRYRGSIDRPENFGSWVYSTTMNVTRDWFRRNKRQGITEELTKINTPSIPPHNTAIIETHRAVQRLNGKKRTVICMRFLVGYNLKETATYMGIDGNTVRSIQHRAMKSMLAAVKG